ncbi:MAG: hypothetical protein KGI64_07450 [Xanthomonadaceae bacterium]|nr:hypothetical protein [Xanthomonadaceae bacterium]MDE1885133.1 hypothetical protein [Xanthomonadaceae bacterium]MDE1960547.1 hypothetical protein [Xanthomonadaceae bacterium]MDE2084683.1 hypothetical protein [Xanthomonadaceae bacterium]MDE2257684.1 hypothetical protein [Xanthomonadaceae bacterium]
MSHHRFVVCINNDAYPASLELRKLYEIIADEVAEKREQVRVVDESGDDYLYPQALFAPVELPTRTQKLVLQAA